MTSEESAVIRRLRDSYNSIHDNLDALLKACAGDPLLERQVGDNMQEALKNYIIAQNRILNKSAAVIKKVGDAAAKAQKEIDQAIKDLKNIRATLNAITKAVKTVGIIVASL